ncbi:hypothetical protein F4774DRAFT_376809 [Daldinia eschscholtzii]|nr:hypothetical protein F4774DRAFT_376809 [Daldinia eschscholtzii]
MMDDVLGLVMVQIVSSLGSGATAENNNEQVNIDVGNTVLRPVLVSLAFAGMVPVACRFVLRPVVIPLVKKARTRGSGREETGWWCRWNLLDSKHTVFLAQTALLIALVVSASFAGASVLLAAYLAGIVVSWWQDSLSSDEDSTNERGSGILHDRSSQEHDEAEPRGESSELSQASEEPTVQAAGNNSGASATSQVPASRESQQQKLEYSALDIYETYYSQAVSRILKPFFFASIGFSIPISDMFSGEVVWRGVIYGILMAIGKMMCGLWLVRIPLSASGLTSTFASFVSSRYQALFSRFRRPRKSTISSPVKNRTATEGVQLEPVSATTPQPVDQPVGNEISEGTREVGDQSRVAGQQPAPTSSEGGSLGENATPAKPLSLYPAAIVSCAMVARGEIGFLISAVAESKGVFRRPSDNAKSEGASELFLVVTWAIVLCTIAGPICVGTLVRRLKKLEARAAKVGERGTRNVLGVWGVQ